MKFVVQLGLLVRTYCVVALVSSSRLDRRAWKVARLLGPSPLEENTLVVPRLIEAKGLKKPAGSRLVVSETDAGTLVVEVPGRRLRASDAGQATFAAVWLSIVGVWTAGALAASPFFALFSTPFWLAGLRMARDLVPSSTTISLGAYAWEVTTTTPLEGTTTVGGATPDLDSAKLSVEAYVNDQPVTSLRILEGVNSYVVRGLEPVEQQFVADLINAWLDHLHDEHDEERSPAPASPDEPPAGALRSY